MSLTDVKAITRQQYYMLLGLQTLCADLYRQIQLIERAAAQIIREHDDGEPFNPTAAYYGHTSDWLSGSRGLDDMLRILGMEVTDEPPSGAADAH